MIPWIILYAVTGWLFNHPGAFARPSPEVRRFSLDAVPRARDGLPSASAAAQAVTSQLAQLAPDADVELVAPQSARWARSLSVKAKDGGDVVRLSLDPRRARGAVSIGPEEADETPASLDAVDSLAVPELAESVWTGAADAALDELGVEAGSPTLERTPRLVFDARIDGEQWRVTHDAKRQSVSFERVASQEVSVKRVLARLHMTHVYPGRFGAAWIHTLIVDLVVFCLLLWSITGLMMWWQMRRLRRVGWIVLGGALAASAWLLGAVVPGMTH